MFFNDFSLADALYRIPAIIIGFTLHEFMHAYVADRLGDPTPRNHGRLTLNPLVHIDWLGFAMLIFAGFGWAKPVYTNPRNYKNYKKGRILVSIAGPLTNLVLALIGFASIYYTFDVLAYDSILRNIIFEFAWINTILFAFNLLPIPPLDGFTFLEMWIKPEKYAKLSNFRNYGFFILIALSLLGVLGIYLNGVFTILTKSSFWVFHGIDMLIALF